MFWVPVRLKEKKDKEARGNDRRNEERFQVGLPTRERKVKEKRKREKKEGTVFDKPVLVSRTVIFPQRHKKLRQARVSS